MAAETWSREDPPLLVPTERYVSPDFARLEAERLWPRVWQVACTADHVAESGDWFEHRCGTLSIVVVRGDDGVLRAFQNACRHRGNALCTGAGSGLSEIRCGFHRWSWDLRGELREVPSRRWFGALRLEDYPLLPAAVGEWGRLVFVNADPRAEPLEEFLEGVPRDAAWARLDDFRCVATTTTAVDANWKVVADGFSETYHVQGLHPEMLGSIDDVDATQRLWSRHGVSYQDYGVPSPRLGSGIDDRVVWESFVVTQGGRMGPEFAVADVAGAAACPMPGLRDGRTVRDEIADRIRGHHEATFGEALADLDTTQVLALSQYNLFPNVTILLWGEMINVLVSRPGPTPDQAELVTFLLYRMPPGSPRLRPADVPVPDGEDLGFVLAADVRVLAGVQRGLHQPGLDHVVVSAEECRIITMQRTLERYLDVPPARTLT